MKIKYRAWYKKKSFMCQVAAINFYYNNIVLLASNEEQRIFFEKCNRKVHIECEDRLSIPENEAILMRYTGFKDKNGKEIYEGDIVRHFEEIGLVKWVKDRYIISWINEKCDYREELAFWCIERNVNVINNIYEKPEYLAIG